MEGLVSFLLLFCYVCSQWWQLQERKLSEGNIVL